MLNFNQIIKVKFIKPDELISGKDVNLIIEIKT